MKVLVTWEETWKRQAPYEVDEGELRAWALLGPSEPIPDQVVLEFLEAGRERPEPTDLLGGTVYPGSGSGDSFEEYRLTEARVDA